MNWFYAKNGAQEGPVSTEVLKAKIDSGEVAPSDLAWREGLPDWMPVSRIPEFSNPAASFAPPVEATPVASASYSPQPSPYTAPVAAPAPVSHAAQQAYPAAPSSGMAVGSLICSLLSILICAPVSIAGVIMGHIARSRAKKDPARFGGSGMALAGVIIGYLGVIWTLIIVGFIFYIGSMTEAQRESFDWWPVPAQREQMRQEYQRQKAERERIEHSSNAR